MGRKTKSAYTIQKYNGDDSLSWALFKNGVPVFTGMGQAEARYELKLARTREEEKKRNG